MLGKITTTLSLAIACVAVLFAIFLVTESEPSTVILDADISTIGQEIKTAEAESLKYSGGLIKTYIDLRIETLRLTETMLAMKRASILRRINLNFTADREAIVPASDLSEIETDITNQRRKIAEAELKAGQYSGGLIQAMALSALETQRMSLALLQLAFYGQKYGIPVPLRTSSKRDEHITPPSPGKVVKDKEAL